MLEAALRPLTRRIIRFFNALVAPLHAELVFVRRELSTMQQELQAQRQMFEAARLRFQHDLDALRAEMQAERHTFLHTLEYIKEQKPSQGNNPALDKLVSTVDAALMTIVLNNGSSQISNMSQSPLA